MAIETLTTTWTKYTGPAVFRIGPGTQIQWREDLGQNVMPADNEFVSTYNQDNDGLQLAGGAVWLRVINGTLPIHVSK